MAKLSGQFGFAYMLYDLYGAVMGFMGRNELGIRTTDDAITGDMFPWLLGAMAIIFALSALATWRIFIGRGYVSGIILTLLQLYSIFDLGKDEMMSLGQIIGDASNPAHQSMRLYMGLFTIFAMIELGGLTAFLGGARACLYLRQQGVFKKVNANTSGSPPNNPAPNVTRTPTSPVTLAESVDTIKRRLREIAALRDQGALSADDYQRQRRVLLAQMDAHTAQPPLKPALGLNPAPASPRTSSDALEDILANPLMTLLVQNNVEKFKESWRSTFAKHHNIQRVGQLTWSWPAFFLGPFYLCYRKMYVWAAGWAAAAFALAVIGYAIHFDAAPGYSVLLAIITLNVKGWYFKQICARAKKIEAMGLAPAAEAALATKQGGVSWLSAITGGLLCLFVASLPDIMAAAATTS